MNDDQAAVPTESAVSAGEATDPQAQLAPAVSADQEAPETPVAPAPIEFRWHASEYVQHHKNASWYIIVVLVFGLLSLGAYYLKYWPSIVVFTVMAITIIIYAKRAPRVLSYELSAAGLAIDGKLYPYSTFRSFSVVRDVAWHSIDLEPTQRFMPRMSVLFNDEDFDAIVTHLLGHLPRADREPDFVERLTRYLRF